MHIVVLSLVAYIKHLDTDCLSWGACIHTMHVTTAIEFEEAKQWCNENSNCGAFRVFLGKATFTRKDCEDDLFYRNGVVTFINGNFKTSVWNSKGYQKNSNESCVMFISLVMSCNNTVLKLFLI